MRLNVHRNGKCFRYSLQLNKPLPKLNSPKQWPFIISHNSVSDGSQIGGSVLCGTGWGHTLPKAQRDCNAQNGWPTWRPWVLAIPQSSARAPWFSVRRDSLSIQLGGWDPGMQYSHYGKVEVDHLFKVQPPNLQCKFCCSLLAKGNYRTSSDTTNLREIDHISFVWLEKKNIN